MFFFFIILFTVNSQKTFFKYARKKFSNLMELILLAEYQMILPKLSKYRFWEECDSNGRINYIKFYINKSA